MVRQGYYCRKLGPPVPEARTQTQRRRNTRNNTGASMLGYKASKGVRDDSHLPEGLFVSQRDHGVDTHRPPRRNEAGSERN
jgi:hypothetical protein